MQAVYLALTVLGFVVPYYHFADFVAVHGLDPVELGRQWTATSGTLMLSWDLTVAGVALLVWIVHQRARVGLWWLAALGTFLGVSVGLPLWLYLRERGRAATRAA